MEQSFYIQMLFLSLNRVSVNSFKAAATHKNFERRTSPVVRCSLKICPYSNWLAVSSM